MFVLTIEYTFLGRDFIKIKNIGTGVKLNLYSMTFGLMKTNVLLGLNGKFWLDC